MEATNIQANLFKQIQKKIAPLSIADELVDLLGIGLSTAYRRINGTTPLTPDELVKVLARYPTVSFEKLIKPNYAPFTLPVLTTAPKNVFQYLDVIESDLNEARQYPDTLISYAAQDLLFFHYLLIPEIAVFKLYMWDRTIWGFEDTKHQPFNLEKQLQNKKLLQQIERIAEAYARIHCEEIWNINMLDVTLNQIQHSYLSGHFKDALQVRYMLTLLKQLCGKMQNIATLGLKKDSSDGSESAKISVWYNELIHNNAFVLAKLTDTQKVVFSVFDSPNFMYSMDDCIYQQSQTFFDKLKHLARRIDGVGQESARHLFFQRLNRKIETFQTELLELEQ